MKQSLMLGAMILAVSAFAATAHAKNEEYGFYTPSGSPYCDGVSFTATPLAGAGYHVYDQTYCPYPNAMLGGLRGHNHALGTGQWYTFAVSQVQGDQLSPSYTPVFYINTSSLLWVAAYESTDNGIAFQVVNSGILKKGKPYAVDRPGSKHLGAALGAAVH